ncbi:transglutaminase TgpA family protein [Spirulina subsalsa]|uniref:transglutaminase TgpA family protein n=1 Tax=Spirulina subsalsa TaxID=54311 RepID=UPI0002EC7DDA|nr:DUF3488 and DUF4129 domain-containing transglutaminase family protein [Spirulina subsalsa]
MNNPPFLKIPLLASLWERLENLPRPKTEESISLRITVQLLVFLGIIATDLAAGTTMSFWAIPLSAIGGFVAWQRRKKRNIALKFVIALGMLLTLVLFFGNLFANLNDTRLVLAELLIQLQVLHSFDLPRRQDLGYSMVIGLILLGVAATLSETLAFAPMILIFLALALPLLVLDYRSRLGFDQTPPRRKGQPKPSSRRSSYSPLSFKQLGVFFLVILGLGLGIFALFPRFPGYQLQTLPVTQSVDLENQRFTNRNRGIFTPGVRFGEDDLGGSEGTGGNGELTGDGSGQYYGFNSVMDQSPLDGEGAPFTPRVVLRVRSQAPGFWRVLGFDRYTGKGWEISRDEQLLRVERPPWTYRFFLSASGTQGETKPVIQTYTVVSPLPNLIPALTYPREIYFPTPEVGLDPEGAIRAPTYLGENLTYTVISDVPVRNRTALRMASTDYPESIRRFYLEVPSGIRERLHQEAQQLLATSPQPITDAYEKALYLAQALKQRYTIQEDFTLGENQDLVETFLDAGGGYPDHFATVLAMLLRSIDIPARVSAGFSPGQFNPFTGFYIVRSTDAHTMTEVYFGNFGWFNFDPMPGHPLIPPSVEEVETFGVLQQIWQWVAGWLPSGVLNFLSIVWVTVIIGLARFLGGLWLWVSGSVIGLLTGLISAIALVFIGWLGWNGLQGWGQQWRLTKLPPVERTYQQMLLFLRGKGYPKHPAQTPLEYAQSALQEYPPAVAEHIENITQAYIQWRYGGESPDVGQLQKQLQRLKRWRRTL